jgi:SAM-dependent methyltransferase
MADYGRQELGLNIATGTLESMQSDESFDLICFIQVIGHFYDLQAALARASELTRPGGHWLIESWNFQSLMARCLGSRWHEYSPPSVLHYFSPQTLRSLLARHGFVEIAFGRPKKSIQASHGKSLMRYKLKGSLLGQLVLPTLHLIPDRLTIPYPSEDLFWGIYQKVEACRRQHR